MTAVGDDGSAPPSTSFTVSPKIFLSATSGAANDKITVNGTGFTPSKNVRIKVGTDIPTTLANINVNGVGSFDPVEVQIPASATGSVTIRVENVDGTSFLGEGLINGGLESAIIVTAPSTPTPPTPTTPQVALTITDNSDGNTVATDAGSTDKKGNIGNTIKLSGTGYNANESIDISLGSQTLITNADATSAFNASLVIALQFGGGKNLSATGRTSGRTKAETFTIEPKITSFSPLEVDIGQTVLVQGNGFGGTEQLTVLFGDVATSLTSITTVTGGTTQFDGTFSLSFVVPTGPYTTTPGTDKKLSTFIRINGLTGLTTGAVSFVKVNTLTASLQASPDKAASDETIMLTGRAVGSNGVPLVNANLGFLLLAPASGPQVTVMIGTHDLRVLGNVGSIAADSSVQTDDAGLIQVLFQLTGPGQPSPPGGTATLRLTGVTNLQTTIEIIPKVLLSPSELSQKLRNTYYC